MLGSSLRKNWRFRHRKLVCTRKNDPAFPDDTFQMVNNYFNRRHKRETLDTSTNIKFFCSISSRRTITATTPAKWVTLSIFVWDGTTIRVALRQRLRTFATTRTSLTSHWPAMVAAWRHIVSFCQRAVLTFGSS